MVILFLYRQKMEMGKEPIENDEEGVRTGKGLLQAVEGIHGHMPVGGVKHLLGFLEGSTVAIANRPFCS